MLMGLRVARTKVAVYAISGFCASVAGLLFSLYMLSGYSLHAVGMELDAIAAVVIGGTLLTGGRGLVVGSLLGVLVLGCHPDLHLLRRHAELLVDQDLHRRAAPGLRDRAAPDHQASGMTDAAPTPTAPARPGRR